VKIICVSIHHDSIPLLQITSNQRSMHGKCWPACASAILFLAELLGYMFYFYGLAASSAAAGTTCLAAITS
jgi:hypothetical protein